MEAIVDLHVHALGHSTKPHCAETLLPFAYRALLVGITELGFTEHDWYLPQLDFSSFRELKEYVPGLTVRCGLEVDYRPGREQELRELASWSWDYVIGSVHEIDGWGFDRLEEAEEFNNRDVDDVYRRYFELVGRAANTGLFQVIGHLDLIKVFGYRCSKPVIEYARPALELIARSGAAVEVNTAGLFRPVKEIYPELALLIECRKMGIPVTLGSDAHEPGEVGRRIDEGYMLAKKAGYSELVTFSQRKMLRAPLKLPEFLGGHW